MKPIKEKIDTNLYRITSPKGKITYQAYWYAPLKEGEDKNRLVGKRFATEKDARDHMAEARSTKRKGTYFNVFDKQKQAKTTLGELLALYEENYRHQRGWPTKSHVIKRLREDFGKRKLTDIKYKHLEIYRSRRKATPTILGKPRKDASVNLEIAVFAHVMQKAVEWEYIDVNPFRKGKRLPYKLNNQRDNYLTEEQAERLLEDCAEHLKPIVETALLTGMRREELLSLRWDQVRDGFIHLAVTKSGKGRKIPINQRLEALLKRQRQLNQLISDYVFCDGEGKRFYDVRGAFRGACRRAGIDYGQDGGFTFHDLRHTFASWLVMRGVGLMAVKELLGHASLTMTMRYAHLSPGHLQEAMATLDGPTIKESIKNGTM